MSEADALAKSIQKLPHLFYVDNAEKCGKEIYYKPLQLENGGYACGLFAYQKYLAKSELSEISINSKTDYKKNDLENTNFGSAFGTSAASVTLGLAICFFCYQKISSKYHGRMQKTLFLTILISIGLGIAGISNEIIGSLSQDLPMQTDKIIQLVMVNIVLFPFMIWILIYVLKKTSKHSILGDNEMYLKSESFNAGHNKSIFTAESKLNKLYEKANEEIESNTKDKGLWVRCFAEANGNNNEATAKYLKIRVTELARLENLNSK